MTSKHKSDILAAIRRGESKESIAWRFGVPAEYVAEVRNAARAVREFQRRGVPGAVLWANFGDMLTRKECGL